MKSLVVVAHNLRSAHNVGSLLRTAEGLGVDLVILSGYTPYPPLLEYDKRLPHEQTKIAKSIQKTALGAEATQAWQKLDIVTAVEEYRVKGYTIAALEQAGNAIQLPDFNSPDKLLLILGREVEGVEPEILALCDSIIEIPMFGSKESYNVVQAAAMALYHCRFVA